MKKLGYTETSRDKGGAVFTFKDGDNSYAIRLAGNPILLLEYNYKLRGGTNFMKNYNLIKEGKSTEVDEKDLQILYESRKFCEEFILTVKKISEGKKSTFTVYKS